MKNPLHSSELLYEESTAFYRAAACVQNDYTYMYMYMHTKLLFSHAPVCAFFMTYMYKRKSYNVCIQYRHTQSHTHLAHGHLHLASCGEEAVLLHPRHADAEVGPHETQHGEVDTQRAQQVRVAVEHITVGDGPGEKDKEY